MNKVFNKKLPRSCSYCVYGNVSEYSNEVFCKKHGVTSNRDYCRHYKYDPLRRQPETVKPSDNYSAEDFSLK